MKKTILKAVIIFALGMALTAAAGEYLFGGMKEHFLDVLPFTAGITFLYSMEFLHTMMGTSGSIRSSSVMNRYDHVSTYMDYNKQNRSTHGFDPSWLIAGVSEFVLLIILDFL